MNRLRVLSRRSIFPSSHSRLPARPFTTTLAKPAASPPGPKESSGDYGSGTGSPEGEDPMAQGTSRTARDHEHPGPASPATSSSTSTSSSSSSSSSSPPTESPGGHKEGGFGGEQRRAKIEDTSSSSDSSSTSTNTREGEGASETGESTKLPRGHDVSQDASRVDSAEVREHNEAYARRHDRPSEKSADKEEKVDKGYWTGSGGRSQN